MKNIGVPTLKNATIRFSFGQDVEAITEDNEKHYIVNKIRPPTNTWIYENTKEVIFNLKNNVIVGQEQVNTEPIFVKPTHPCQQITVQWKLTADEFHCNGSFEVPVYCNIEKQSRTQIVDNDKPLPSATEQITEFAEYLTR